MPIRLTCSTLCAPALTAAWWASSSAHEPATGRIVGNVTLVSPGGAPLQPGADAFALDERLAGRYELAAWHEPIGENVTAIEPGRTARATFVLPIDVR